MLSRISSARARLASAGVSTEYRLTSLNCRSTTAPLKDGDNCYTAGVTRADSLSRSLGMLPDSEPTFWAIYQARNQGGADGIARLSARGTTQRTPSWTAQQVVEAFPFETAPRFPLRDRVAGMGESRNLTARKWLGWAAALGELMPLHLKSAAADGAECGKVCKRDIGTHWPRSSLAKFTKPGFVISTQYANRRSLLANKC